MSEILIHDFARVCGTVKMGMYRWVMTATDESIY